MLRRIGLSMDRQSSRAPRPPTHSATHLDITLTIHLSSSFVIPLLPLITFYTPIRTDNAIGGVVVWTTDRAIAILRFVADGVAANTIGDVAKSAALNASIVAWLLGIGGRSGGGGAGGGGWHGVWLWKGW